MKFVVSVGGSVLYNGKFNTKLAKSINGVLSKIKNDYKIVAGGGTLARDLINQFKFDEESLHQIGIMATKINAFALSKYLGFKFVDKHPKLIGKMKENTVSGGYKPGWSTDVDAAIIAKYWGADALLNLTNVDHMYTRDPKEPGAKPIEFIDYESVMDILGNKFNPGMHYPIDPRAIKILKVERIPIYIFKGVENLRKILLKKEFIGTRIN